MSGGGLPPPPIDRAAPSDADPTGAQKTHQSDGPATHGRPHDMPTAAQLLEAVREFVESDVLPQSEGRVRFHARVAVNVLGMVLRELELGPAQAAAHAERLRSLGVSSESELADAIRSGAFDERLGDVRDVVRATVIDKLAVANPGYS